MAAFFPRLYRCLCTKPFLASAVCQNVQRARSSAWRNGDPRKRINFTFVAVTGVVAGAVGHASMQALEIANDGITDIMLPVKHKSITPPKIKASRFVSGPVTKTGLKLTLFQYQTCPFCCKVRAFLQYYGIPFTVIEVDPVLRQQLKFSEYRKVPILLVEDGQDCWQINDSTVIVSMMQSYLIDKEPGFKKYLSLYEPIEMKDASGKVTTEVLNKYHLMLKDAPSKGQEYDKMRRELKWRTWADDTLVHVLSPNVYRTRQEALQAFNYFSEVGQWEANFPAWERLLVIYVGAAAMYLVGKRLKKRHNLKDDVRQSFRDACNEWMKEVGAAEFHGGNKPNLADLAVYGVLNSVEGCTAFKEMLEDTSISSWYWKMKGCVSNHLGSRSLNSGQ
ncbi:prostaglandin E synthase 2-like [Ornithodoros turicata]|uniref:prostaglandin E synthase 2-like n=1 Tax=Ornithodoros turicata TaxID=34597 RepID=UPI0031388CC5